MFVVWLTYSNFPKILRQKISSLLDFSLLFGRRLLCQIKRLISSQRRNELLIILSNIAFNFVSSLLLYISRIFFSPDITLKPQFPLIALRSELDRILVFSKQVHTSTVVYYCVLPIKLEWISGNSKIAWKSMIFNALLPFKRSNFGLFPCFELTRLSRKLEIDVKIRASQII